MGIITNKIVASGYIYVDCSKFEAKEEAFVLDTQLD